MKKPLIIAMLFVAPIVILASNPGNIITLKGEALIFPELFWLFMIPLVIVLAYVLKVSRFGRKEKG